MDGRPKSPPSVDGRPKRELWALFLLLGLMWVDYAFSISIAIAGLPWAAVYIELTQLGVAVGIGSFDLAVLWLYIGIWEYKGNIRLWMRSAFSTERRARLFSVCPRCGYESEPEAPSRAEQILRERERVT